MSAKLSDNVSDIQGEQPAGDVLTLHRQILARWSGPGALAGAPMAGQMLAVAERMIAHLPGLASLTGTFGGHAWELATAIADSPLLLHCLGGVARAMTVAELADLVQVVLEEDEADGLAELDSLAQLTSSVAGETARAGKRSPAAKRTTHGKLGSAGSVQAAAQKGLGATKAAGVKSAARRGGVSPIQAARMRALRQVLAQLRERRADDVTAGDARGLLNPAKERAAAGPISREVANLGGANELDGRRADAIGAADAGAESMGRNTAARPAAGADRSRRWLDPLATLGDVAQRAPRALRLAEAAAEFALLEPAAADAVSLASAGERASGAGAARESAAPSAAQPAVPGLVPALRDGPVAAAAWAVGRALAGRTRPDGSLVAGGSQVASDAQQSFERAAPAAAGSSSEAWSISAPATGGARPAPRGPTFAALPGLVRFAANQLARANAWTVGTRASVAGPAGGLPATVRRSDSSEVIDAPVRLAGGGSAPGGTAPARGRVRAWADAVGNSGGSQQQFQRFAAGETIFASPLAGRAETMVPGLARWLAGSERALHGAAPGSAGANSWQAAGEILHMVDASADAGVAADRPVAGIGGARRAVSELQRGRAASAGVPSWLVARPVATRSAGLPAADETRAGMALVPRDAQSVAGDVATAPTAPLRADIGSAAAVAAGMAVRLVGRLVEGLVQPMARLSTATARSVSAGLPSVGAFDWTVADTGIGPADIGAAPRLNALSSGGGAGELLDLTDLPAPNAAGASASDRAVQRGVPALGTARPRSQAGGQDVRATARGTALAHGLTESRRAPAPVGADRPVHSPSPRIQGAWAQAAAAAVERIQTQAARSARSQVQSDARLATSAGKASTTMEFAALHDTGLLAVRPAGRADALTPWLDAKAPGTRRDVVPALSARSIGTIADAAGAGELVSLQGDAAADAPSAPSDSQRSAQAAVIQRAATRQAGALGPAAPSGRILAAALGEFAEPAALQAALRLFGGNNVPARGRDTGTAWLARWLGRPETAQPDAVAGPRGTTVGDLLAPADADIDSAVAGRVQRVPSATGGAQVTARPAAAAAGASTATGGDKVVLTGLAALTALRTSAADLEQLAAFQRETMRPMQAAESERTLLASGPAVADVETAPARGLERTAGAVAAGGRTARPTPSARTTVAGARAGSAKTGAVQLHEFVPTGLRRGRSLLSNGRRTGLLSRVSARTGFGSESGGRARSLLAGYGDSALGPGELVGLTAGDSGSFFGESAPAPYAASGADRLASAVYARRSVRTGRGHIAAVAASMGAEFAQPQAMALDGAGPSAIPGDFRFGQQGELVDPAAAVQRAVVDAGRGKGASAAMKSVQAGAMARVLSVTAAPTENMLPLVAPAASAVVHAAAAKPLSESIVTSGSDASLYTPITGTSGAKKKGEGGKEGGGGSEAAGDNAAQDLDALAHKVARAVMVRIKRERERRGIHG